MRYVTGLVFLIFLSVSSALATPITTISLAQFSTPQTADFSGFSGVTSISNTSDVFRSVGIESIMASTRHPRNSSGGIFSEFYETESAFNAGNALFAVAPLSGETTNTDAGLFIISPGQTFAFGNPTFTIDLLGETNRFGFRPADTSSSFANVEVSFFSSGVLLGTHVTSSYSAANFLAYETETSFDQVVIGFLASGSFIDGAGLAQITFDPIIPSGTAIPIGSSLPLLGAGIIGLLGLTRQRSNGHANANSATPSPTR